MPSTRPKDTTGHLWIEQGEDVVGPVASVALIGPVERLYSYAVPPEFASSLSPGQRVNVPVGKRARLAPGFCVAIDRQPWTATLKPIESLIDDHAFLTDELLVLGRWMAGYYACPLGRTLKSLVPEAVRKRSGFTTVVRASVNPSGLALGDPAARVGHKQRAVLDRLLRADAPVALPILLADSGASRATVRTMEKRGWVRLDRHRQAAPAPDFDHPGVEPDFDLNPDQRAAVDRIAEVTASGVFRVMLLFGVAGSGKTEVYVRAMRRVLSAGRQVIMLVPEIALTTQLVDRLAARFTNVAVIHSGLTGVHRSLTWSAIRAGEKQVIIGTRSAVFAPCPDLGLIVVDEEQESSYKNLQAPRFHVRDVAVKRAQMRSIPVVLGSATPSLESWCNCDRFDHFERIELSNRVRDLPMPAVTVVDLNDEFQSKTGIPLVSRILVQRLRAVLERNEQAVLLLNRRGYANWLFCPHCKQRILCPRCNVNMVYHAPRRELLCHYCHRRTPATETCPDPSCGGRLIRSGGGTQRVEELLNRFFPDANIERVDSDTMRHPRAYARIIADFESRKIDCLIGTQMIAKGLDFPYVSFVGVLGAETPASLPDFRAAERLFQLVTQVAGRAGRADIPGQVVVQTESADAPALLCAVRHDFRAFVTQEIDIRRRTRMPPFTRLTRIVIADPTEPTAQRIATELADLARGVTQELALDDADLLGPMPCVLARLRNRYRYEFLLRCQSAESMGRWLDHLRATGTLNPRGGATVQVDVDPLSLT